MLLLDLFRVLLVLMLVGVGVLHTFWFLAAWTRFGAGVGPGRWGLPGDVTIRSPLGKVWGAFALFVVILFIWAALALLASASSWRSLTFLGIVASFLVVGPWRSQSPASTWLMTILADLVLLFILALPVSVDLAAA